MRRIVFLMLVLAGLLARAEAPWEHGRLRACADRPYLEMEDGTPFFWLANTGWLLPQKSTREEVRQFLDRTAQEEYNVVLVQTLNGVPSVNAYGQSSHIDGWKMISDTGKTTADPRDEDAPLSQSSADRHPYAPHVQPSYGYWDHMDYIIDQARERGIYIGMVCIWGGLVKGGKMDVGQARAYGEFLAHRYAGKPNIIWVIGGDIKGDVKPEVWEALATTIKANDPEHAMTFHPFGRTSSAWWWNDAEWLDFNLFQSGHRRYDQTRGDGADTPATKEGRLPACGDNDAQAVIPGTPSVAEDNWRYVIDALSRTPRKPVIDGEPVYEGIPQGLHDTTQPRWQPEDVRRYAWWSVLSGAAGHTYGHNSIMQMFSPGDEPAYGADLSWQEAMGAPGFTQMKYVKRLMERLPYSHKSNSTGFTPESEYAISDQSVILSANGDRYDRAIALRGDGFIAVYTYTNQPLTINLDALGSGTKHAYWYSPVDGSHTPIGTYTTPTHTFLHQGPTGPSNDHVLLITTWEMLEESY